MTEALERKPLTGIGSELLAGLDYLIEHDERQPEISGYSLARQIYSEVSPQRLSNGSIYKALYSLASMGYVVGQRRLSEVGKSDRVTMKTFYSVTDLGRSRLEHDAQRFPENLEIE